MRQNLFNGKLPTRIGLLIIVIGTFVTTFLVKNGSLFQINAGPGQDPKNVEITNVSDVAFTVSYTTDDQVIGTINYGTDPGALENIVLDDRDQLTQSVSEYKAHSISLKGLSPNTVYYFMITSGTKTYLNNGSNFNIKTGNELTEQPSDHEPLSGRVVMPDGSSPLEGLVYASINGSQKISAYIKNNGNYTIPLNTLRSKSFNAYFSIKTGDIINIEAKTENLFSSASVSEDQVNPVPIITLSNNYDFSDNNKDLKPTDAPGAGGFPSMGTKVRKNQTIIAQGVTTPSPSEIPVETPTPTSIPPTPEITPTPILLSSVSGTLAPTIPPTGNSSVIISMIAAVTAIGGGIILFLLTRGQISQ
ncbi:MAG: hypothetical protein ACD_37C00133G0006 [uncultured bacterium]|nr:MAG: hypothetical protein ACD_37C00133G0006 [uncultured bacterium]